MRSYLVSAALSTDLDVVHALLAAVGARLAEQGFANWTPPYPRERLEADIASAAVWVVRDADGALVATYMLRAQPVPAYEPAPWADATAPARYLNRLAVDPERHGRSIGRWCLAHIAEQCVLAGARAIRCDVLAANERLCGFYERAGYIRRGTRKHSGWEFICYERQMADSG